MIYDGECRFCRCQVERWRKRTGSAVEYVSSSEPRIQRQFSEISTRQLDRSLQFVTPEGWVYAGAHGALKALAVAGRAGWLLHLYETHRSVSALMEIAYRLVAGHRGLLSRLSPCAHRMQHSAF
jgi:predicted DCC family thiol-disulfide oxidoreductase YuxK